MELASPGLAQAGNSQPFTRIKEQEERPCSSSLPLPIRNGETVVVEEVCGLITVSEEQRAHHPIQGKGSGPLCAHSVGNVQRPERVPADLRETRLRASHPTATKTRHGGMALHYSAPLMATGTRLMTIRPSSGRKMPKNAQEAIHFLHRKR